MQEKTLSEKGLGGGGSIVVNKYLQVETRDDAVWCDNVFLDVGNCDHGCVGSPEDWDKDGMNPIPKIVYLGEEQTIHIPAVSLAEEIVKMPVVAQQQASIVPESSEDHRDSPVAMH